MFADELFDIVPSPSPRHPEMFDLILIGEASHSRLADTKHLRSFRAGDKSRTMLSIIYRKMNVISRMVQDDQ